MTIKLTIWCTNDGLALSYAWDVYGPEKEHVAVGTEWGFDHRALNVEAAAAYALDRALGTLPSDDPTTPDVSY